MKFFEAMELVSQGKVVRRKNWQEGSAELKNWYVMLNNEFVFVFYGNHVPNGPLKLTKANIDSDDWEVVTNSYEIELAALKRKHGVT